MGFGGALIALFYVSIVQLLLLAPLLVTKIKIKLFDFKLLRLMVRFSLPFLPASIFFIMIEMADRIMLGWLSSVDDVGLYGAGYKIGALILLIVKAFNLNWQPFYLKPENQDANDESNGKKGGSNGNGNGNGGNGNGHGGNGNGGNGGGNGAG